MARSHAAILALLRADDAMPAPEIIPEEDNCLCLDWGIGDCVLSVSVSADGGMAWAALIGEFKTHGLCYDTPNSTLLDAMRRWREHGR